MKHNLFSDRFHLSPEIQDENLFLMQLNGRISRRKKKEHHHSGRYSATGRPLILFPVWHIILFPFSLNVIWELSIINGPLIGHFFDWHFLFLFYFPRNLSVVPFTNCKNKPKKKKKPPEPHAIVGQNFLNLSWSQENLFDCLGNIDEADLLFSGRYRSCLNKWSVLAGERQRV